MKNHRPPTSHIANSGESGNLKRSRALAFVSADRNAVPQTLSAYTLNRWR